MSSAASSAFELLAQLDAHAQGLIYSALQPDEAKALRLTCWAARDLVDGAVRRISIVFRGDEALDARPLAQLCDLLEALPTCWPQCNTLGLTQRQWTMSARTIGTWRIDTLLTQALLCKRPGAARLTGLRLQIEHVKHFEHVKQDARPRRTRQSPQRFPPPLATRAFSSLDLGLLCGLAVACPALRTLALEGHCGLSPNNRSFQKAALQALSRLPRLSDLTLPGPAGLQHVGLLAGQLTRLALASDSDSEALSDGSTRWDAKMSALASLTRLVELDITCGGCKAFGSDEAELQLFESLPPSLQRLNLGGLEDGRKLWDTRYTFEGGRPATVHLAGFPPRRDPHWLQNGEVEVIKSTMELHEVYLRLKAAGALQEGHRMRRLSCPELTLIEDKDGDGEWYQLLSPEQERGVRELLAGCEEVRIHTLVIRSCIQAPTLQQAEELLRGLTPSPRLTLQLGSPYHRSAQPADYSLSLRKPLVLPSASAGAAGAAAAAHPAPAHAQGPGPAAAAAATQPPPPPTELELLRSLVCVDGTARHVLLACKGVTDALYPPRVWLRNHAGSCTDSIAQHIVGMGVSAYVAILEYGTAQGAAGALLALQGLEYGGLPVFALPVRTTCPRDMTLAAMEVLRAYLEHGDVTADKVVAALEAWDRFSNVVKRVVSGAVGVLDGAQGDEWAEWRALCKEAVEAVTKHMDKQHEQPKQRPEQLGQQQQRLEQQQPAPSG